MSRFGNYPYHTFSDEVLVKMLKTNNELALQEIFERYHSRLFRLASAVLHDDYLAEDLVQDVFIDFWSRRHTSDIRLLSNHLHKAIKFQVLKKLSEMIGTWKQRTDDTIRFNYSIMFRGQQLPDGSLVEGDTELAGTNAGKEGAEPARYNYKVYVPAAEQTNLSWMYGIEQNARLLRFADILLIDAEAELNLGSESEALITKS